MAGDGFTRDRLAWLDQVAADAAISPSGFKIAFVICRHINRATLTAWPSQATLGAAAGLKERMVRNHVELLAYHGHLHVDGSGGRNRPNTYRLALKTRQSSAANEHKNPATQCRHSEAKPGNPVHETRQSSADKPGNALPQNTKIEHIEEHTESISSDSVDMFDGPQGNSPNKKTRRLKKVTRREAYEIERLFDHWYAAYPKHEGRKPALAAYVKIIRSGEASHEQLLAGAERYAAQCAGREPRHIKLPTGWLRDARWLDEPAPGGTDNFAPHRQSSTASNLRRFAERVSHE